MDRKDAEANAYNRIFRFCAGWLGHRGFREFWSDCFRHGLISTHGERWTGSGSSAPEQQRERYDWVRSDCAVAMNMSQNFAPEKETHAPGTGG